MCSFLILTCVGGCAHWASLLSGTLWVEVNQVADLENACILHVKPVASGASPLSVAAFLV